MHVDECLIELRVASANRQHLAIGHAFHRADTNGADGRTGRIAALNGMLPGVSAIRQHHDAGHTSPAESFAGGIHGPNQVGVTPVS